jgi:hypothetical protein
MTEQARPAAEAETERPGVRRLTPANTTLFEGTFSMLHCAVKGEGLFRGVYAVRLFPVRYPTQFLSLRYTTEEEKDREIGVIEDLSAFPPEQRALVQRDLSTHYCERVIRRVHGVRTEYGLLFFRVETQRGEEEFIMPWRGDRAEDYGENGKVLLDSLDNRYIIPDTRELPPADFRRFKGVIYW